MRKCTHCGMTIENGWYVCPNCGNHQEEKTNNERTNAQPAWYVGKHEKAQDEKNDGLE